MLSWFRRIQYANISNGQYGLPVIASFPKSGNTWVSSVIAVNSMPRVKTPTIAVVRKIVPELEKRAGDENRSAVAYKTHLPAIGFYVPKVVLLVREPVDVIRSYKRYLVHERDRWRGKGIISLIHPLYGFPAWVDFHRSWLNTRYPIAIVRYADLCANPIDGYSDLFSFLGVTWKHDRREILNALRPELLERKRREFGDPNASSSSYEFFASSRQIDEELERTLRSRFLRPIIKQAQSIYNDLSERCARCGF